MQANNCSFHLGHFSVYTVELNT
uniref:Uncharacterized protein n=1 Tax=Arundo donax TaxID=35708 RepID=A0A0A9AZ01_ARUDO